MKRGISVIVCLLYLLCLIPAAYAQQPKIVDQAGLLTDDAVSTLNEKAQNLADTYGMDVVILTVDSLDGKSSMEYADDYYDDNGYGIGENHSGVLFLIAMEDRDWYMSTCGDAIYALTDYGIEAVFSEIAYYLSIDDFDTAFDVYLNTLPNYFSAYAAGTPIDGSAGSYDGPGSYEPGKQEETYYYQPLEEPNYFGRFLIALLIGAICALVVVLIMAGQMNTAKQKSGAQDYLTQDSFRLHTHRDIFLYSRVSRRRKPENNSGGGSSVHRSSGGRSHGGGGGKF